MVNITSLNKNLNNIVQITIILSDAFVDTEVDYPEIARELNKSGASLEEIKSIFFEYAIPICGENLKSPTPSIWTFFDVDMIADKVQELTANKRNSLINILKNTYNKLIFKDLWKEIELHLSINN